MNFRDEIKNKTEDIERIIYQFLPAEEGYQKKVTEAVNYSLKAGGKRIRPMLMLETYRLFGGKEKVIEPFMAAIEMIHTYSLVHDDLPAMDNDDFRRGKMTTHKAYGEAVGILAGDGLLNLAFETAGEAFDLTEDYKRTAKAVQILSKKAGIYGMIGGQTVDVEAAGENIDIDRLQFIYKLKTGALIEASMMIGAVLAGADTEETAKIEKAASEIGMAFQIQDDILDVTSTTEVLGKPVLSDEKNEKTTFVTLLGIEASKAEVKKLSGGAMEILSSFEGRNLFLEGLVEALIHREK